MPLFEFECLNCKKQVSVIRNVSSRNEVPGNEEGDLTFDQKKCSSAAGAHDWFRPFVAPRINIPPHHRAAG